MELKDKKITNFWGQKDYDLSDQSLYGLKIKVVFKDGRIDEGILAYITDRDEEDELGNPMYGIGIANSKLAFNTDYAFDEEEAESITIIKEK